MYLNGKRFDKETLLSYIGSGKQLFGIRPMEYRGGDAHLVRTYEVETGAGLAFSVGENKGMDIYRMTYKGMNLGFLSKAGLHSPYNVEPESEAFRYSQGCGMLYTAGITNVGGSCRDDQGVYFPHGMIKNASAADVTARGAWEEDRYRMEISGDLTEASFYGRNLHMRRTITAYAGDRGLTLEDEIENRAYREDQVMILYHFNAGYPMLAPGARLLVPKKTIMPATPRAQEMLAHHEEVCEPIPMEEEHVYCMTLKRDEKGMSGAALWNPEMRLGLYIRFDARVLGRFVEWKCMRAGDYALGMLPANCFPFGREEAAKDEGWTRLKPFETMRTHLEIGVLEGDAERTAFEEWLARME